MQKYTQKEKNTPSKIIISFIYIYIYIDFTEDKFQQQNQI